ncbi:MAG: hypothetical protein ACLF0G_15945 [Candidatus Brocadiia bacterium]
MRGWLRAGVPAALLALSSCVIIRPPKEPIHLIVDVNLKIQVDRELDKFFEFEEEAAKPPKEEPEKAEDKPQS